MIKNNSAPHPSATIHCSDAYQIVKPILQISCCLLFPFKTSQLRRMFFVMSFSLFLLPFMPVHGAHPSLASHWFFFLLLFLCRASIVQKRIIYFQDEGSLTKRMCEKGRLCYWHEINNLTDFLFLSSISLLVVSPLRVSFLPIFFYSISFILDFDAATFFCGVML